MMPVMITGLSFNPVLFVLISGNDESEFYTNLQKKIVEIQGKNLPRITRIISQNNKLFQNVLSVKSVAFFSYLANKVAEQYQIFS
jgi:hypothetical protein